MEKKNKSCQERQPWMCFPQLIIDIDVMVQDIQVSRHVTQNIEETWFCQLLPSARADSMPPAETSSR